jgi:hypothetical protein
VNTQGSIEPDVMVNQPQVTVQTSAFVDDLGAMYYEVCGDRVSFFFGRQDDNIHIAFTDLSLMNLARLANRAVCAMLRERGIPSGLARTRAKKHRWYRRPVNAVRDRGQTGRWQNL